MRAAWGLLLGIVLCAAPARAQETGGSTGGSDFSDNSSGSSSSSSSDWSSSSSSSDTDWSSSSSSSSGRTAPGASGRVVVVMGLFVGVFFVMVIAGQRKQRRQAAAAADPSLYIATLSIGLDAGARRAIQETMARLALSGKAATRAGRAEMLHEAVVLLKRARTSWAYAKLSTPQLLRRSEAEPAFKRAGMEARTRFTTEVVRGDADGARQADAPAELRARGEEGAGFVVVTIIVVARYALADSFELVLDDFAVLGGDNLVALELVWSPAADQDRMSSAELEQHYPELRKLDATRPIGEVVCKFCSQRYPGELLKCPNCGGALS